MSNLLVTESKASMLILRLDHREKRNCLSKQMIGELVTALKIAGDDASVTKIMITGTDDVFSAGADINYIAEMLRDGSAEEFAALGRSLIEAVISLDKTTVAAINGLCYGGGLDLALACDRRIATPNATFCHPGVNRGFITPWGGTQRLPRLTGEAAALEMLLTGEPIDAEKALRIGLIGLITDDLTAAVSAL